MLEQEKEKYLTIEKILAKEIKEYKQKQEQCLATEPLPKNKNKIKALGNKIKAEFKQVIKSKEFPKPIKSSLFKPLLTFSFILV